MGEPRPIKEGALPAGSPETYGGREAIRQLLAATRPEEFGGVADAYQATADLLGQAAGDLDDYASRLVADGDWGGESARAMLERLARMQSYLGTLRSRIDDIPPALQQAGRDLATAKEQFEQAAAGQDDAAAVALMRQLNSRFAESYASLPDRLPWDAPLAAPAPAAAASLASVPPASASPENASLADAPRWSASGAGERLVSVSPPAAVPATPGGIPGTVGAFLQATGPTGKPVTTLRPAGNDLPYQNPRSDAKLGEAGPTMRPGVVPVVGAAPPAPAPPAADGAGGGAAGQAGMPFMPMGGGPGHDGTSYGHRAPLPADDSFFAPPAGPGHPVVD